ncbi:hypothetical protein FIBSPDRAFT_951222 [Athelia psychrophila]|uniref:Uncharacterized protein n=1 Tax=Athelia psychrophila TaxID=1759441 RepID=A0A166MYW6_9AGAM|nr:hypothetical protein FIBSPDRAFT_951222 [Fibularhizoctonia sp. CBS 109695]
MSARSKNQKKVVVRTPSRQESDEEPDKFDEMPVSQASMTSSDAGTDLFEHFVASYASAEDDIRKIWVQIKEEQRALLNIAIQQHASSVSQSSEREKGQVKGLASVKRACDESQKLIEKLVGDI